MTEYTKEQVAAAARLVPEYAAFFHYSDGGIVVGVYPDHLRIGITWDIGDTYVCAFELCGDATWCEYFSDHSHDPDAALRRAIVRAAAAMASPQGETKEEGK